MTEHAPYFQASSASRWMTCPGSVKLCEGLPDATNEYAERGTRMHEAAAALLTGSTAFYDMPDEDREEVEAYAALVQRLAKGGNLMVEQRVDFSHALEQPDCFGTADAIILHEEAETLTIVDLKTGRNIVEPEGPQLKLYALGALHQYGMLATFSRVVLVIFQGGQPSIHETTVEALEEFASEARWAARQALNPEPTTVVYFPTEHGCRFCKAKAHCPALAEKVADTIGQDFQNLDAEELAADPGRMGLNYLAHCMATVALVEDWCKGIRARTERELLDGNQVDGWKLVQGRKGARKWSSEQEAEAALRKMKLKVEEIYDLQVISPTSAEKLAKAGTIGPRQWPQLQQLITQSEGAISVAPASDKRPAVTPVASAEDFEAIA